MLTEDVIAYFADPTITDEEERRTAAIKAMADALDLKLPSVYGWKDTVPPLRQLQIEKVTHGKLKADVDVFKIPSRRDAAAA